MRPTVTTYNVHIEDSYAVPKKDFDFILRTTKYANPLCKVFDLRSMFSLRMEWAAHNALYALGILRSRTKDVDLNAPICWLLNLAYCVSGMLVWLFIK